MSGLAPPARLRRAYHRALAELGAAALPERPLLREPGRLPILVGSAVVPQTERILARRHETNLWAWSQRTLSLRKVRETGRYPLAHPFEIALAFVATGLSAPDRGLECFSRALAVTAGCSPADLLYRIPAAGPLGDLLRARGVPDSQLVTWSRDLTLGWGAGDDVEGQYVFPYLPYRSGVVPIGAIGFDLREGRVLVDGTLFLERLSFIAEEVATPYEGSALAPLGQAVDSCPGLAALAPAARRRWVSHVRTIRALLEDQATTGASGAGHVLKSLIRALADAGVPPLSGDGFRALHEAAGVCLRALGSPASAPATTPELLADGYQRAYAQMQRAERTLRLRVQRTPSVPVNVDQVQQELGLGVPAISRVAAEYGAAVIYEPPEEAYSLRNQGYPFHGRVDDPLALIRDAETARLKRDSHNTGTSERVGRISK